MSMLTADEAAALYFLMEEEKISYYFFDDEMQPNGKTFLHFVLSADNDHYNCTSYAALLLKCGADINKRDNDGVTPLQEYSDRGSYDLATFELLLEQKVSIKDKNLAFYNYVTNTDDHKYIFNIFDEEEAMRYGDYDYKEWLDIMTLFLRNGVEIEESGIRRYFSEDELETMAKYQQSYRRQSAQAFINAVITTDSICCGSILFYAIREHDNARVELLLKSGADPAAKNYGRNALDIAAIFNNVGAAELLLKHGAAPNLPRLLHCACCLGHYAFAKWCIEQGADIHAPYDNYLPIYHSAKLCDDDYPLRDCDYEVLEKIREQKLGMDDEAKRYGDYAVTYLLVLHGANPFQGEKPPIEHVADCDYAARDLLEELAEKLGPKN